MKVRKKWILFFLMFLTTSSAWGKATLGIWPVRVHLTPDQKIGEVTIRNKGENEVKAQVYAKTWDMSETGEYIETDTGDFVFFPRLLTIPGGKQKVLRVGYNGDFPPVEKPYRLYIQELPDIQRPEEGSDPQKMDTLFNFLLKLSVPVFVRPSNAVEPIRVEIVEIAPEENGMKIKLRNAGTRNILLQKIDARLMDSNGAAIDKFNDDYTQRVLPKRSVFLTIPLGKNQCGKAEKLHLKLFLHNEGAPLTQNLNLKPGCALGAGGVPMNTP
jgi:P pilus assembly chaperone PapD